MSGNDYSQSGNVLSLASVSKAAQTIEQFETYWNKVRGNRLVPSRCEIDPRGLEGNLSNAFILERITSGLARFRIAGAHLSELTDLELRQMPISALFLPSSREMLSNALEAVFDDPAIVRLSISSPSGFGRPHLQGEMILMPLRSDLGDIDRVLGGLVLDGKFGRTPRRIEITSQSRKALTGFAGSLHAAREDLPSRTNAPVQTGAPRRSISHIERTHLRLVVSNS